MTIDKHNNLRNNVWRVWDMHSQPMYVDLQMIMHRLDVDIDEMCTVIETYCGDALADGFRDWYEEDDGQACTSLLCDTEQEES